LLPLYGAQKVAGRLFGQIAAEEAVKAAMEDYLEKQNAKRKT